MSGIRGLVGLVSCSLELCRLVCVRDKIGVEADGEVRLDSMWISTIGSEGWLCFVCNQLWRAPQYHPGTDRRVKPYVLFRVPTYNKGKRVMPQ